MRRISAAACCIGWWFWGLAHVWYLIGFRSRVAVSFEWLWSYLTFKRGARLITGRELRGVRSRVGTTPGFSG